MSLARNHCSGDYQAKGISNNVRGGGLSIDQLSIALSVVLRSR
jgi:hypothetical protein